LHDRSPGSKSGQGSLQTNREYHDESDELTLHARNSSTIERFLMRPRLTAGLDGDTEQGLPDGGRLQRCAAVLCLALLIKSEPPIVVGDDMD
jgi:hypothetical protein